MVFDVCREVIVNGGAEVLRAQDKCSPVVRLEVYVSLGPGGVAMDGGV